MGGYVVTCELLGFCICFCVLILCGAFGLLFRLVGCLFSLVACLCLFSVVLF